MADMQIEGMVFACWCGHTEEQHRPQRISGRGMIGDFTARYECFVCGPSVCDEWQPEFAEWVEKTTEHERGVSHA